MSDYNNLLHHLSSPSPLSIEILPSSHPPHLLSSPPSLGIPRKLLLHCFLHARSIFHNHRYLEELQEESEEVLQATKILTLWEPGWGSAWAVRKKHLLGLRARAGEGVEGSDDTTGCGGGVLGTGMQMRTKKGQIQEAVEAELAWVETLVTSPLDGKQAKSSWVWTHRMWILQTFPMAVCNGLPGEGSNGYTADEGIDAWIKKELQIVMIAGERHPRNYYAWNYARGVIQISMRTLSGDGWEECMRTIHQWCLTHPRDISGWAFLVFLIDQRDLFAGTDESLNADQMVEDVFVKTIVFVRKFGWRGESVEWFLGAAKHLGFEIEKSDRLEQDSSAAPDVSLNGKIDD
ncbi:MAG: hypothetical protein Q9204_005056 [Flavoplaca sp. TL-2023a]